MLFSPLLAYIISYSTFDFTYLPYFAPSLIDLVRNKLFPEVHCLFALAVCRSKVQRPYFTHFPVKTVRFAPFRLDSELKWGDLTVNRLLSDRLVES